MSATRSVHIETLHPSARYSVAQINRAVRIAYIIGRGKLVLCEPPERPA